MSIRWAEQKKSVITIIFLLGLFVFNTGCQGAVVDTSLAIVPWPQEVLRAEGFCTFDSATSVSYNTKDAKETAVFCASLLQNATGWPVPMVSKGKVQFVLSEGNFPPEGYRLVVSPKRVVISAGTTKGLFYGFQTLRQLLPPAAFSPEPTHPGKWQCPCVTINDAPRYRWRGVMSDVARHFHDKEVMIKMLDGMAAAKLNTLHWHLTDDQGWRIEIKKYPKLAAMSKQFYTQEDIRQVVSHARKLGITIVPEIDVPGHSRALLRAYPQLLCRDEEGQKRTRGGTLCPGDGFTYEFLDTVIGELAGLFPGPYIHIGADEVGKGNWKVCSDCKAVMHKENLTVHHLQTHFVNKVAGLVTKHGKIPFAWDEALNDKAHKELRIMSWRGMGPGMKAAKAGRQTVMCPVSRLYFDRTNSRSKHQKPGYSHNTVNLHLPYFFEAASPLLTDAEEPFVLGAQANVWGEKIRTDEQMLRLVFPRSCSLAEALWNRNQSRDWDAYIARLKTHLKRLDQMGIPYFWEPMSQGIQLAAFSPKSIKANKGVMEWDVSEFVKATGLYEFTIEYVRGESAFSCDEVTLLCNGKVVQADKHSSTATVCPRRPDQFYRTKLSEYDPAATYTLRVSLSGMADSRDVYGVVILIPPLPEAEYSAWGKPK